MVFLLELSDERVNAIQSPEFAAKSVENISIAIGMAIAKHIAEENNDIIDLSRILESNSEECLKISQRLVFTCLAAMTCIESDKNKTDKQ